MVSVKSPQSMVYVTDVSVFEVDNGNVNVAGVQPLVPPGFNTFKLAGFKVFRIL